MSTLDGVAQQYAATQKNLEQAVGTAMAASGGLEKALAQFSAVGAVDRVQGASALKNGTDQLAAAIAHLKDTAEKLRAQLTHLSGT